MSKYSVSDGSNNKPIIDLFPIISSFIIHYISYRKYYFCRLKKKLKYNRFYIFKQLNNYFISLYEYQYLSYLLHIKKCFFFF